MFFFIKFLGKGLDHSIGGSSSFLDIIESFRDLVLVLVLVIPVILVGALSGFVSGLVTVETQPFLHMVCYLFSRESVNVHCIWVWGKFRCGYVLADQGLYSTLSSYYFLYLAPLVIKSTGMGVPIFDCGRDSLERVDFF